MFADGPSISALLDPAARPSSATLPTMRPGSSRSAALAPGAVPPELQFVPASSRAKRVSLGALAALTVGPTASIAAAARHERPARPNRRRRPNTRSSLTEGAEGRQVELLQQALGNVAVDGIFGPETEEAVKSFQARSGLTVDGIVGPQTSAALRGGSGSRSASIADVSPAKGTGSTQTRSTGIRRQARRRSGRQAPAERPAAARRRQLRPGNGGRRPPPAGTPRPHGRRRSSAPQHGA